MGDKKTTGTLDVTQIDKAIAQAKNRKATRGQGQGIPAEKSQPPKAAKEGPGTKRPRLTDEEKAAREQTKATERADKKATRDTARAAKKAEKDANKSPAHMKKVLKAAERLGTLDQAAQLLYNEAIGSLTAAELAKLATHITHHNRVHATQRALSQKIEVGTQVRIVGGDPRFIGQTGTIFKAQRIRCYVTVEGLKKPVYLFTSDVEAMQAQDVAAAG